MECVVGGKGEETPKPHSQGVKDLKSSFNPHLCQGKRDREGREGPGEEEEGEDER